MGDYWGVEGPYLALNLSGPLPEGDNFYGGGKIKSGGVELDILTSDSNSITIKEMSLTQDQKNAFIGPIEVYDDDDSGTGHPLPNATLISPGVKSKFKYAYIDIVSRQTNPRPTIPFELYSATLIPYWPDDIIVISSSANDSFDTYADDQAGFWNHYMVAQYQGAKQESADPLGGDYGIVSGQTFFGGFITPEFSTVYLEVIREVCQATGSSISQKLDNVVAHEIGHVPGHFEGHFELGLMADGAPDDNFSAESLRRFRATPRWEKPW
jgi:hypothetical protein